MRNMCYCHLRIMCEEDPMDCQAKIKELREETGLNRKAFCEKFEIPYRTVTEW